MDDTINPGTLKPWQIGDHFFRGFVDIPNETGYSTHKYASFNEAHEGLENELGHMLDYPNIWGVNKHYISALNENGTISLSTVIE